MTISPLGKEQCCLEIRGYSPTPILFFLPILLMSVTKRGGWGAGKISKKVKAKLEGGQREGKRGKEKKRQKERRKTPIALHKAVRRKQAQVPLPFPFPGQCHRAVSCPVHEAESTVRPHPAISPLLVILIPWGGRWHPGQQHQLWSDSLVPSLATVGPWEVINL